MFKSNGLLTSIISPPKFSNHPLHQPHVRRLAGPERPTQDTDQVQEQADGD